MIVEVERNLEVLTKGIPEYALINEVPLRYQRHIVGVLTRMGQLLNQVIRVVLCYHEHHVGKYPSLSIYFPYLCRIEKPCVLEHNF